ncbi:CIC11C00000002996 [Sungouiella intermedia]|uniref:CIC11C00000001337 n=1 Tax=Sungouiella intermedia TaxID=45354 RepID=A0A1L0DA30_9ASCO|nr:CIC11C00000001337 [[Candida] intermedia]SGZ52840.1 CIC11C00000002996 [[Candida] intermedia]
MPISRQDPAHIAETGPKSLVGKVKIGGRPYAISRPSNDDITNLRFTPQHQTVESLPNTLPNTPALTPVMSPVPLQQHDENLIMTASNPPKNLWRIIATCIWSVSGGFSDAAPGALLPFIESDYGISYAVVSLIWMLNAAGFILVAMFSHKIQPWLGKRKSILVGCLCSVVMYLLISSGGPFPLIVTGFFFGGIGLAIVLAQSNVFFSKLDKNSKYLAFMHGAYGVGATLSPLLATSMVNHGIKWHYFYLIALVLMLFNCINCWFAFGGADDDLKPWDHDDEAELLLANGDEAGLSPIDTPRVSEDGIGLQDLGTHITAVERESPAASKQTGAMMLALQNPITWLISLFVLCYQGSEVSLGGWIVSYLLDSRGANNSYGYVLSGFWGGLTLGRLVLTRPLHKYFGARRSIIVLTVLTIGAIVLTWTVANNIVLSVLVSLAGTMIGPTYPLMITIVSSMLPRKIQVVSLTIMTAFGSSGGAILPFLIGLGAEAVGTYVVLPVFIATYSVMLVIWLLLPNVESKGPIPDTKVRKFLHRVW